MNKQLVNVYDAEYPEEGVTTVRLVNEGEQAPEGETFAPIGRHTFEDIALAATDALRLYDRETADAFAALLLVAI